MFKFQEIIDIYRKIYDFFKDDTSLISKEGYVMLRDPDKKIRLRKMIYNYHKTGKWDFSIMNEK